MKRFSQRGLSLLLALAAVICLANPVRAAGSDDALEAALADTAQYVCAAVPEPQVGSIGGEWAVLGLARSGYAVPEGYYQSYYDAVEAYVKARNGILHDKKYTEYARVILALTAIGRDARDVAGYDLTLPLGDYDKTVWQGLNGPIWALIALDSGDYPMPERCISTTSWTASAPTAVGVWRGRTARAPTRMSPPRRSRPWPNTRTSRPWPRPPRRLWPVCPVSRTGRAALQAGAPAIRRA